MTMTTTTMNARMGSIGTETIASLTDMTYQS